ncbi:unnamed protein product [Vitrella brassicaformis CCMP3155]|uniref:ABC1 atypical kinase-like domain-containing protein n=1 Tax=Vitrella brassicaformis (strain CCMP3155) TaxID=1169540 RepID=A0A0G4FAN8_VITBC|nr:unnamed protein product [Vitrella brassicaformis CCMP3155]|eukprot:CEM09973.1 unnamed protein product [Vitrella brassicaformis CCMP3155]
MSSIYPPSFPRRLVGNFGRVVGLAGITLGATCTGVGIVAYTDQGARRNAYFWARAFPVYIHYRWTEWLVKDLSEEEQNRRYDALHELHAPRMEGIARHLKGFYIKLGQLGSTRTDFLAEPYLKVCERLQDDCPTEPFERIVDIIENSLGKKVGEVFRHVDHKPLGSASIGQVHKAELLDGTPVVVKVQFPDAERMFRIDIKTAQDFCRLVQPDHLPFLKEVEKQFMTEFDYRREAENLDEIADNVLPVWGRKVVIPRPFKHLCTREVLVMEYVPGTKLADAIKRQYTHIAASRNMTLQELIEEQDRIDRERESKGLEREVGPSALQYALWQTQVVLRNAAMGVCVAAYNWTVGWVLSALTPSSWGFEGIAKIPPAISGFHEMPINIPQILDVLMKVHGHELFHDGAFNGDPHPGNILLTPDGKLGLIDYGQVKHITREQRLNLAHLVVALAEKNYPQAAKVLTEKVGLKTKNSDERTLALRARMLFDRDDKTVTGGMNAQAFFESLEREDPLVHMPDDYVMAWRLSLLMRGMGWALRYPISTAEGWYPIAKRLIEDQDREGKGKGRGKRKKAKTKT